MNKCIDTITMDIIKTVADNIRNLKQLHKLTNTKMAKRCKVSEGTINRAMSGQTALGVDNVELIANGFGLSGWQLMIPGLNPDHPPVIYNISPEEKALYDRLRAAMKV